jgi:protein-tyrosine phosphatase
MQEKLKKESIDLKVESAGIYGYSGQPASIGSINAANSHGLILENHKAQNIMDVKGIENALILTMTQAHKEYIQSMKLGKEVYTLYEYTKNERKDIKDPFGLDDKAYIQCAKEIKELINIIDMENLQ